MCAIRPRRRPVQLLAPRRSATLPASAGRGAPPRTGEEPVGPRAQENAYTRARRGAAARMGVGTAPAEEPPAPAPATRPTPPARGRPRRARVGGAPPLPAIPRNRPAPPRPPSTATCGISPCLAGMHRVAALALLTALAAPPVLA